MRWEQVGRTCVSGCVKVSMTFACTASFTLMYMSGDSGASRTPKLSCIRRAALLPAAVLCRRIALVPAAVWRQSVPSVVSKRHAAHAVQV